MTWRARPTGTAQNWCYDRQIGRFAALQHGCGGEAWPICDNMRQWQRYRRNHVLKPAICADKAISTRRVICAGGLFNLVRGAFRPIPNVE